MLTTTTGAIMTEVSGKFARGKKDKKDAKTSNSSEPSSSSCDDVHSNNKVCVIGAGSVGTAVAFSLLSQKITNNLVLIDPNGNLVKGEILDMENAMMYIGNSKIVGTTDYEQCKDCRICVITAGFWLSTSESKQTLATKNCMILKEIVANLVRCSPNATLIVVTPPVDICTYAVWKVSKFPAERVIGTGTILESSKFRRLIAEKLGVATSTCQAYIIGEQGDNSIPVWSGVTTSGVKLKDVNPHLGSIDDPEDWQDLHLQSIDATYEVNLIKNGPSWGIALAVSRIVKAILQDDKVCLPVSTHIMGCRHGIEKDVYLSLPCIIGANGVERIVKQILHDKEKAALQKSANTLHQIQKQIRVFYEN